MQSDKTTPQVEQRVADAPATPEEAVDAINNPKEPTPTQEEADDMRTAHEEGAQATAEEQKRREDAERQRRNETPEQRKKREEEEARQKRDVRPGSGPGYQTR